MRKSSIMTTPLMTSIKIGIEGMHEENNIS